MKSLSEKKRNKLCRQKENEKISSAIFDRAKIRLTDKNVRLSLILGCLIWIFAAAAGYIGFIAVVLAIKPEYGLENDDLTEIIIQISAWLTGLFAAVPVGEGVRILASRIADGEDPDLRVIFIPFSSFRRFMRTIAAGTFRLLRIVIPPLLFFASLVFEVRYYFLINGKLSPVWLDFSVSIGSALAGLLIYVLTRRLGITASLVSVNNKKLREAFKEAKIMLRDLGWRTRMSVFFGKTFFLTIISVLSLFVLFYIHTAPLMLLIGEYNRSDLLMRINEMTENQYIETDKIPKTDK